MKTVAVFCASSMPAEEALVEAARQLGQQVAQAGMRLVYGGSNLGLMGVVSSAALQQGGEVVGVIPNTFSEEIIFSQEVTELVRVSNMAQRKEHILAMSDLFVALPGGIGTIDEVSEVMVANQLRLFPTMKPIYLLNINGFYNAFLQQIEFIQAQRLMRSDCGMKALDSVEQLMALIG